MEAIKEAWDFFQSEILGMGWLDRLVGAMLNALGLDTASRIGGSVRFFRYDMVKIMVLLCVLIMLILPILVYVSVYICNYLLFRKIYISIFF